MRQLNARLDKTFLIADTLLSTSDDAADFLKTVDDLSTGSLLVSCGNLFDTRCPPEFCQRVATHCRTAGVTLWCVEGSSDHRILWTLGRERRVSLGGDVLMLCDDKKRVVLSYYGLANWPQKKYGAQHFYGDRMSGFSSGRRVVDTRPLKPISEL